MDIRFDNFNDFISLENSLTNSFRVRTMYVDIVDDLISGLLLSQIIYWYSPSKSGNNKEVNKLRVEKEGYLWIAKQRGDWWDEIRITARQYDRAKRKLEKQGLIKIRNFKFDGLKTQHIRLVVDNFLDAVQSYIDKENQDVSNNVGFNESVRPDSTPDESNSDIGFNKSVKPELTKSENGSSRKCKTGLNESVRPLTMTTNNINNNNNNKGDFQKIVDNFSKAFRKAPNDFQTQALKSYTEKGLSEKLVLETIRSCAIGGHNQSFFFNKLKTLINNNILTVGDLQSNAREESSSPAKNNNAEKESNSNYKWKDFFVDFDKYKE